MYYESSSSSSEASHFTGSASLYGVRFALLGPLRFPRPFARTMHRIKSDPFVISIRVRSLASSQLLTEIAYKGNASKPLVSSKGPCFLRIMVNLREPLVKGLLLRRLRHFRIAMPFMDIHRDKIVLRCDDSVYCVYFPVSPHLPDRRPLIWKCRSCCLLVISYSLYKVR